MAAPALLLLVLVTCAGIAAGLDEKPTSAVSDGQPRFALHAYIVF
jgi:hypothetical protein